MSYLTESESTLWAAVIAGLEGEGFAYDPLTVSMPAYLATCLGQPTAHKTKSVAQMLAELNGSFGGTLSHLTSSIAQLLDDVAANIGAGGGGGELPPPPEGFAYLINAAGAYLRNADGAYILAKV